MPFSKPKIDKLAGYLAQLSPDVAAFLIREIEIARMEGRHDPLYEPVLAAARDVVRGNKRTVVRPVTPLRVFCEPFEDLLHDGLSSHPCPGRVTRGSIAGVWRWLLEQAPVPELPKLVEDIEIEGRLKVEQISDELQDRLHDTCAGAIETALHGVVNSDHERRRLETRLGGPPALRDAGLMAAATRRFGAVRSLREDLPLIHADPPDATLQPLIQPIDAALADVDGMPELAFATVLARFARPPDALRIAVLDIKSNSAAKIMASSYSPLVTLLLHDTQLAAKRVEEALTDGNEAGVVLYLVAEYHVLAEGMARELDLGLRGGWVDALASARRQASERLEQEIQSVSVALTVLFRPWLDRSGGVATGPPEELAVHDAKRALALYTGCRPFVDQLSLNETLMRLKKEIRDRLRATSDSIVAALRASRGSDRLVLLDWLNVSVELTRTSLGVEEADLLARAGQVAAQSASAVDLSADNAS